MVLLLDESFLLKGLSNTAKRIPKIRIRIAAPTIAHSHHFLKIDFLGSFIVGLIGFADVAVGFLGVAGVVSVFGASCIVIVDCVAGCLVFATGIVFGSSTMDIVNSWNI